MKQTIYDSKRIYDIISGKTLGKAYKDKIWYRGIDNVRSSGILYNYSQEEILEYAKCHDDPIYFIENYCFINTPDGLKRIELRDYQKKVLYQWMQNRFNLTAVSRQVGMTTLISLAILHTLLFKSNSNVLIFGNVTECSMEKMEKVKQIYRNLPFFLQRGVYMWNLMTLRLENGSSLRVGTSAVSALGMNFDEIYIDDYAHIHKIEELYRSLYPTLSARTSGKLNIVSNVKGNNHFRELLENAERPEGDPDKNNFVASRIYWWQVPGRDNAWKAREIEYLGSEDLFEEEYNLKFFGAYSRKC
jgi:hypothetical protein